MSLQEMGSGRDAGAELRRPVPGCGSSCARTDREGSTTKQRKCIAGR